MSKSVPIKYRSLAVELGYVMAVSRFDDWFHSNSSRKRNWDSFDDAIFRYISTSLKLNFTDKVWDRYGSELKRFAYQSADSVCGVIGKAISIMPERDK